MQTWFFISVQALGVALDMVKDIYAKKHEPIPATETASYVHLGIN